MTINKQPNVPMHAVKNSERPRTSQGARRVIDEAPGLAVPNAHSGHDSEVASRARRLQHTNADERRILQAGEHCTKAGGINALMRHEDANTPSLITRRRQGEVADLAAVAPVERAPNADPKRAATSHMAQLTAIGESRTENKLILEGRFMTSGAARSLTRSALLTCDMSPAAGSMYGQGRCGARTR